MQLLHQVIYFQNKEQRKLNVVYLKSTQYCYLLVCKKERNKINCICNMPSAPYMHSNAEFRTILSINYIRENVIRNANHIIYDKLNPSNWKQIINKK